ncbi:hypothetical protein DRJ17_06405 [Candidatus Woesearchaeota archaeon]|nr:MAG: hypothetical protein DRJ17_06405 [Candidatus Woesearchaeota archaeon]
MSGETQIQNQIQIETIKSNQTSTSTPKYPQNFEELCTVFNSSYVNSAPVGDGKMWYVLCELSSKDKVVLIKAVRTNKGWFGRSRIGIEIEKIETVISMLKKYEEEARKRVRARIEELLKDEVTRKVLIEELKRLGIIK